MKVSGIIAEYNPFHNGHKWQIDLLKEKYDTVVAVMSGSFVQRGDVAITSKWSRAKSALLSGCDLVLELPCVYSMSTADRFAFGGVSLLNSLGCIDAISFGSESGDIHALKDAANHIINETEKQSMTIQTLLDRGYSYATARQTAFSDVIDESLFKNPNNILGIEYIKHLSLSGSSITPITHKRQGEEYKSPNINTSLASASAIRDNCESDYIKSSMPDAAYEIFKTEDKHFLKNLDTAAISHIRIHGPEDLKNCPECVEGLENRIYDAARKFSSIEEITNACSTKRYTKAKIRRIILSAILGINKNLSLETPKYARVLGATQKGCKLLSEIKKQSAIEIITKTADYKKENEMFYKDILATDVWALSSENSENRQAGLDYTISPVMK